MLVSLLRQTADPEGAVALAARLCYSPAGIGDLERGATPQKSAALVRRILGLGHHSVLEHASFTFGIEGISRAASHQLVRHRIASYSQQSQRYVAAEEGFPFVVPPAVGARPELLREFRAAMRAAGRSYRRLLEAGVAAEDARFVLPNAAETRIIVTMNARELRHFCAVRCCRRAQWEIRRLAERMLGLARDAAPVLFEGCGPACVTGPCPEKAMACGLLTQVRAAYRGWRRGEELPAVADDAAGARG
jgi:thymidylate synthase (FAD)